MTKLYDYEFRPWRIDGDRRIVADERVWDAIRKLGRAGRKARVSVPVDVFERWDGRMRSAKGLPLERSIIPGKHWFENVGIYGPSDETALSMSDVRRLSFSLIDDYPNLTWLLETSHLGCAEKMISPCPRCRGNGRVEMLEHCPVCNGHGGRKNLWLYARCDTQAEADARIPHLLRCPAAVRGLVMEPREAVDLAKWFWAMDGDRRHGRLNQINHVIIRGGTEPLHPDNVRSIVRQCEVAGVPVWCESPVDGRVVKQLPEAKS